MAGAAGLEPAMRESKSRALTAWLHSYKVGGLGGSRTHDARLRGASLYPLSYETMMGRSKGVEPSVTGATIQRVDRFATTAVVTPAGLEPASPP